METQKYRDFLIERAASAFARDQLDEAAFEAIVARVQTAPGEAGLRAVELDLPPSEHGTVRDLTEPDTTLANVRDYALNMGNLKKKGDWVDARAYRLDGKMSNFELDFRTYAEDAQFLMTLDVDLSMSNLKLIIPPDWQVDCRITRNSASNIVDRGSLNTRSTKRILITGTLSMSNIRVRRRGGQRRGLLALLFGW